MAVNRKWHRWIYASVADHVHAAASGNFPLLVDFLDKADDTYKAATCKAQCTITGPRTREISRKMFRVHIDVFIVVTSDRAPSGGTDYVHIDKVGLMAETLDQCIRCVTYGEASEDEFGVLRPRSETGDEINPTHLRPAEKDTQIHSTIEARFIGFFKEQP